MISLLGSSSPNVIPSSLSMDWVCLLTDELVSTNDAETKLGVFVELRYTKVARNRSSGLHILT